jgi:HAD superfamily phosphoserine phosphatase-like hydrolase
MNAKGVAALEAHRSQGARLILLSASPDLYVREIGARLGFNECICTELVWKNGRLVGDFASLNMRDAQKSSVVLAIRERASGPIAGYANSISDLPHLQLTDYPVLVNGSAAARRLAVQRGISCARWV